MTVPMRCTENKTAPVTDSPRKLSSDGGQANHKGSEKGYHKDGHSRGQPQTPEIPVWLTILLSHQKAIT